MTWFAGFRRWSEPWYWAYGLTGMVKSTLALMLVPLIIRTTGSATEIGVVVAAFYLGGMTAPIWGELADRYRLHRVLLAGGMAISGLALACFTRAEGVWLWMACMFVADAGAAMAATVGNLLIVESHPQEEWPEHIGWLQTFYGAGQVFGLLAAAIVTVRMDVGDYRLGLALGGLLVALGAIPAWLKIRTPPRPADGTEAPPITRPVLEHGGASPQNSAHARRLRQVVARIITPQFALLLLVLVLAGVAAAMFYALYPVLMHELYGVRPSITSLAYAAAAVINLALYARVGTWSHRFGQLRLLRAGLLLRTATFALLFSITLLPHTGTNWLAVPLFMLIAIGFSLISVTSTALVVRFAPAGRGEALGLYNAATAVAYAAGSVVSGVIADHLGFAAVPLVAAVAILAGLVGSYRLRRPA